MLLHDQQHPPSSNYPQQLNPSLNLYLNHTQPHPPPANTLTFTENSTNNHQPPSSVISNPPIVSSVHLPVPPAVTTAISTPTTTSSSSTVVTTPTITNRPHHNDMNDASNISKILQLSISNGSGSISTNNNINLVTSASDKRSHDSLKYYQREDSMKESKTIGRPKKKETKSTTKSAQPSAAAIVNNQHKHVNGSSDVKLTNNTNHHQNGAEECYSEEEIKKWEKDNQDLKKLVFIEIRRLGRDYTNLFVQLEKVKGTFELQHSFVQICISECHRFKRLAMAKCIEKWFENRNTCKNGQATMPGKLKI